MTKKKKIFFILAILSLILCVYTTAKTYAKYFTQEKPVSEFEIKRWNIIVNEEDIQNKHTLEEKIPIIIDSNINVAENKLAPESQGFFEIKLDYTNTNINFKYEIEIEENEELKDLIIYKIEIDNEDQELKENETNKIINEVQVNTENKTKNIKVYLKWNDDIDTETMNNQEDTNISKKYANTDTNINLNVKMSFTQSISTD